MGSQLDSLNKSDNSGCFEEDTTHPRPLGCSCCLDRGQNCRLCQPIVSGDVLGSLFLGEQEQHLGVGWGFSSWRPFILSPPTERTQTNSSVGGWGRDGSPNPGAMPNETRIGLPAERAGGSGQGGEVQQHQSHSEHSTMGRTRDREDIKTKLGCICPGLLGSLDCRAGFGQLGESL